MIDVFKKPDITTIYFEIVILFFGSMKVLTTRFQGLLRKNANGGNMYETINAVLVEVNKK